MAKEEAIDSEVIDQVQQAIGCIIESARCLRLLTMDLLDDIGTDQEAVARVTTAEMHAERIGWIADLCNSKLGGGQFYGDAVNWTFPLWTVKALANGPHQDARDGN